MGTTADKLEQLNRTKENLRAVLEREYPELDFTNIPFKAYPRLVQGETYIDGLIHESKAYGKSNDIDETLPQAEQERLRKERGMLRDLSGNGTDIQLFGFDWEYGSGYGLYNTNFKNYRANELSDITLTSSKIVINRVQSRYALVTAHSTNTVKSYSIRVSNMPPNYSMAYRYIDVDVAKRLEITKDGVYRLPTSNEYKDSIIGFYGNNNDFIENCNIIIEQIPEYAGALVSDGVDDYGICENFPILKKEDGLTICAIRQYFKPFSTYSNGTLLRKERTIWFEASGSNIGGIAAESFDGKLVIQTEPLFSYLTSKKFNDKEYLSGSGVETSNNLYFLCNGLRNGNPYQQLAVAFYALRVYDHDLTPEELAIVRREMVGEFNAETKGYGRLLLENGGQIILETKTQEQ